MYHTDQSSDMAIPVKSVHDMDTSDSPYEGGYVDVKAKGEGKPIVMRDPLQNTLAGLAQVEESEPLTDDGLQQKKWAVKINATGLPLDYVNLRDVDQSDVNDQSPAFSSKVLSDDGPFEYLVSNKEMYKLSKSPGKKKVESKHSQRRAIGLNPYRKMKKYKDFNEVMGHLPEQVSVSGKTYKLLVNFIPQGPASGSLLNLDAGSKETNLLEAGTIDRPPEMTVVSEVSCPEMMAYESVGYDEPLNLSNKPLDLSTSLPLNLSMEHQTLAKDCPSRILAVDEESTTAGHGLQEPVAVAYNGAGYQPFAMRAGDQPCTMRAGDQPCTVVAGDQLCTVMTKNQPIAPANVVPEKIPSVVDGNMPNIDSLNLGNSQSPVSKDFTGKKTIPEMLKAGEVTMEQLLVYYLHNQAMKESSIPNGQLLLNKSLPGSSNVIVEAQSLSVEKDDSNPLPNLCSLELANNSGEMYVTEHERTKLGLKAKVLNR